MRSLVLISITLLLLYQCAPTPSPAPPITVQEPEQDTIGHIPPIEYDRTVFDLTFDIKEYQYKTYTDTMLSGWVEGLPEAMRDSLIYGKLVVSKHFYLNGITWQERKKLKKTMAYDSEIEQAFYGMIGMAQGMPSAVFSSHFHSSEDTQFRGRDVVQIKIGQLTY